MAGVLGFADKGERDAMNRDGSTRGEAVTSLKAGATTRSRDDTRHFSFHAAPLIRSPREVYP